MKTTILLMGIMIGSSLIGFAQEIEPAKEMEPTKEMEEVVNSTRERVKIADLPDAVKQGFEESEYGQMNIVEAYALSAEAAKKVLDGTRDEKIVVEEETMLYELQVEKGDHRALLYFTAAGELYSVSQEEGIG